GLHNLTLLPPHQQYHHHIHPFNTQPFPHTFQTNLYPLFSTLQKPLQYLKPPSSITTTSSLQRYNPTPILHHYPPSKPPIISLTKTFSQQLRPKPIPLNSLPPPPFSS
ncbi:SDR family NAD(P)-dependent oxidoreductase, partial [Staphylococcus capitis]|uniref:SDR family NAD(P)-dependent oxidoreductase n=1 Tax=Staphylococcus capitis TaxID=29388 RepID=UPI0011A31AAC